MEGKCSDCHAKSSSQNKRGEMEMEMELIYLNDFQSMRKERKENHKMI